MAQTPSGSYYFDVLSCGSFTPPAGCITDNAVQANAQVNASKLQQQATGVSANSHQIAGPTTTVATVTQTLGMALAAGTLIDFSAWIEVAAVGGATVTVDLQASVGGGAYATVLTATLSISSGTAIRTAVSGTFSTASYAAGTIFRAVVVATAGGGTLPQGLTLRLTGRENSQ